MAAMKKAKKSMKASEQTKPAQPVPAPELPQESRTTPADTPADTELSGPGPPVAGLVASAGGLDAFKKFFAAMPADSGIAFVLIPHLDPQHESLMVELLTRHTSMPVVEAAEGMAVEANCVYIIPPNKNMTFSGGVLRLTGPVEGGSWQTLIDLVESSADAIFSKDLDGTIRTWNRGAERLYGYSRDEIVGRSVKMLVPEDHADEWTKVMGMLARGEHVEQLETERVRKDGQRVAVALTVSPIRNSEGKVVSASVIGRDISRRKELEREVVEIASLQERRIGQDLHDSVSQELTALSMLAGDLAETLRSDPSKASQLLERLVLGLQRSQQELRAVMRGLRPVSVDAEGLMAALSDLAKRTHQQDKVTCVFDCRRPVLVDDNLIATHLYLIAQEAVHNAVKHARCQNIRISVESDHLLILRVQDDGIGVPDRPAEKHGGLGLRIMRNRAAIIRATLTIEPRKPAGTVVTCALARKNHEP